MLAKRRFCSSAAARIRRKSCEVTVESGFVLSRYCECDLAEETLGEWIEENIMCLTISPYELITFLVQKRK